MPDEWKDQLSEPLREAPELKDFKDINSLGSSYINSAKAINNKVDKVTNEDSWDTFDKKAKNFLNIPEDVKKYKLEGNFEDSEKLRDLGHKYKIHPMQMQNFLKDYTSFKEEKEKGVKNTVKEKWTTLNSEEFKKWENKDILQAKALNHLGETSESFKKALGEQVDNPSVQKMLLKFGKYIDTIDKDGKVKTTAGGGGGDDKDVKDPEQAEEKLKYIRSYLTNSNSAYYDPKSPSYSEVRSKIERFTKELTDYQMKTGIDLKI